MREIYNSHQQSTLKTLNEIVRSQSRAIYLSFPLHSAEFFDVETLFLFGPVIWIDDQLLWWRNIIYFNKFLESVEKMIWEKNPLQSSALQHKHHRPRGRIRPDKKSSDNLWVSGWSSVALNTKGCWKSHPTSGNR